MRETVSENIPQNCIVKSLPNLFLARNPSNRQASVEKQYTVKKAFGFLVPSREVTYQTLPGVNNLHMTSLFPPRESLVSDIPAGDGNIEKLFLRCRPG